MCGCGDCNCMECCGILWNVVVFIHLFAYLRGGDVRGIMFVMECLKNLNFQH